VAVNKNFVVKNGFEVSNDLILANAETRRVAISHTNPKYTLDVSGGIGATDFYLTGIGTFVDELNVGLDGTVLTVLGVGNSIGIGTALPAYLLDIRSPVSTGQTALYVQGDVEITGDLNVDDINLDEGSVRQLLVTEGLLATGVSTFNANIDVNAAILISGISTFNDYVDINDSVDISENLNVVGLTTLKGYVNIDNSVNITRDVISAGIITASRVISSGASFSNVIVSGLSTFNGLVDINNSVEISNDLNVSGNAKIGRVDINSGIINANLGIVTYYGDGNNLILNDNPSTGIGIGTTGGLVGFGITFLNLLGPGVSTTLYTPSTGIATIFLAGSGGGIIGIGTSFPSFPPPNHGDLFYNLNYARIFVHYDEQEVGAGTDKYWVDAAPFTLGSLDYVFNVNSSGVNITGIITAIAFYGDGSNLTGTGSTVVDDTDTNDTFYPVFTQITSGIITASRVSTPKLTFNPSTGTLTSSNFSTENLIVNNISSGNINASGVITATAFYGNGSNLTGTGSTVSDDITTNDTFYPVFTKITSGIITASRVSTPKLTFNPFTGDLNAPNIIANELRNATLANYNEKINALGNTGFSKSIDLSEGSYVTATLDQNTIFTFVSPPSGFLYGFSLALTNGFGGPFSIIWPASVKWPSNIVPVRTTASDKTDLWFFTTIDGGTSWYGSISIYNLS